MSYREFMPSPALRPFVDRVWALHSRGGAAQRVLPDGCLDIIVDLERANARVVGAMTKPLLTPTSTERTSYLAVRFKPGCASVFLGVPANELTDDAVELRALGGFEDVDDVRDRGALMQALINRARDVPRSITHAVQRLSRADAPSTAELARELGWSRQHLRRVFLQHVGLAPKAFACVARMQRTVISLQNEDEPLVDAALSLGYVDQAHLARELRLLAGATATQVRAEPGSILPIRSLFDAAAWRA